MVLEKYINKKFGVNSDKFLEVLQMSPWAEWYLHGSLSELLFKDYIESKWYEIHRIKEKPGWWYNSKSNEARWDFYIRKKWNKKDEWFVIENKWIKTNTEKHLFKINTKPRLFKHLKFLAFPEKDYIEKTYEKGYRTYLKAKEKWENRNKWKKFPKFNWDKKTPWARSFTLEWYWKNEDDLRKWVDQLDEKKLTTDSYLNLEWPIKILSSHAPNTRPALYTGIISAAPLVSDFNIMCVDLFQRIWEHKFVFMNSNTISHSPTSPEHLYQNYHIDYIIPWVKDNLKISPPWYTDIEECIAKTNPIPRKIEESQLDKR